MQTASFFSTHSKAPAFSPPVRNELRTSTDSWILEVEVCEIHQVSLDLLFFGNHPKPIHPLHYINPASTFCKIVGWCFRCGIQKTKDKTYEPFDPSPQQYLLWEFNLPGGEDLVNSPSRGNSNRNSLSRGNSYKTYGGSANCCCDCHEVPAEYGSKIRDSEEIIEFLKANELLTMTDVNCNMKPLEVSIEVVEQLITVLCVDPVIEPRGKSSYQLRFSPGGKQKRHRISFRANSPDLAYAKAQVLALKLVLKEIGVLANLDLMFEDMLEEYLSIARCIDGSKQTTKDKEAKSNILSEFFEGVSAREITQRKVNDFVGWLRHDRGGRERRNSTINKYIKLLQDIMRKSGYAVKFKLFKEQVQKPQPISDSKQKILFSLVKNREKYPLELEVYVRLGFTLGLRGSELQNICWKDFDERYKHLRVTGGKMRDGRTVKVEPATALLLHLHKHSVRRERRVFQRNTSALDRKLRKLYEEAGISG